MPKKFVGENSKAVAARARKAAVKEAENIKKAIEAEDKAWEDNDKQLLKKKQKQVRSELLSTDMRETVVRSTRNKCIRVWNRNYYTTNFIMYTGRTREKTSTAIREKSRSESFARKGDGKYKNWW
jgi:hypothetical protein